MEKNADKKVEQDTPEATVLNVFITGGVNPVGRAAAAALASAGHKVTAVVNGQASADAMRAIGVIPVFSDPTRAGELKGMLTLSGADIVIHAAPMAANEIPLNTGADYTPEAVLAETEAILEAAAEAEVKFIVHTSFAFLYGDHHGEAVDETTKILSAGSALVEAAYQAEKAVEASAIASCILRAGYVYDENSPALVDLTQQLKAGRPIPTGSNENVAGWVHAADVAAAIALVLVQQPDGAVFNVVDDNPVSAQAFLEDYANVQGIPGIGRAPGFLMRPLLGKSASELLAYSAKPNNSLAKEKLGWSPRFADHNAGFEYILLQWRANMAVES